MFSEITFKQPKKIDGLPTWVPLYLRQETYQSQSNIR